MPTKHYRVIRKRPLTLDIDGLTENQVCSLAAILRQVLKTDGAQDAKGVCRMVIRECEKVFDVEWQRQRTERRRKPDA